MSFAIFYIPSNLSPSTFRFTTYTIIKYIIIIFNYLAEILYGFIKRDYKKVAEIHFIAGLVPKETSKDEFAQALRSIGEPIFGHSVKNISGSKLLSQLFEVTEKFNMQTQIQLLLLQKTMVVVEGVARKLNPETDIWEVSKPSIRKLVKRCKRSYKSGGRNF